MQIYVPFSMSIYFKPLTLSFLTLFACLGLGRFGYGMILPSLQNDLQLLATQAGFISTSNFIGYLIGIFFIANLYKRIHTNKLIFFSLLAQALCMILMSLSTNYLLISFFYTICGFFIAISNISVMVYISHIIPLNIKGKALGLVVSGNAAAIIFSGFFVPKIESSFLNSSWKINWVAFALITVVISVFIFKYLEKDDKKQNNANDEDNRLKILSSIKFYKISSLYLIFGITYVIYVTFFVTAIIDKYSISTYESGVFWSYLGFISLFSGFIFGHIADKIGAYKTLFIIFILQTISNFILVQDYNSNVLWISSTLFGLSVWAVPSLITLLSSIEFGIQNTAKVFSLATLIFAIGQIIGPVTAGFIYDMSNDFSNVFAFSATLTLIAVILSSIFSLKKED